MFEIWFYLIKHCWGIGYGGMWRGRHCGEGLLTQRMEVYWGGGFVWCSNSVEGPNGVCLWKSTRKGWEKFCSCVSFKVGDSSSIKFWHHPWCGGPPLKEMFPELYGISRHRDASVAKLISLLGDSYRWNINFHSVSPRLGFRVCGLLDRLVMF